MGMSKRAMTNGTKSNYSLLSRLMLMHNSDFWNFHAAWFRFVDGRLESQSQRSHKHMLYELHYVLKGRLSIVLEHGKPFTVDSGQFIIIPPRVMHFIVDEAPPSQKLVSGFDIQSENAQIVQCLQTVQKGVCCWESETLRQLVQALHSKVERSPLTATSLSPFLVQSIILEMLEIIQPPTPYQTDVKLKSSINDERVQACRQIIRDHIQSNIMGRDVANQLGMSLRHLNRLCNASCGCSIHHLILQERMERARFLLESTSLSLTDISEMIGYSSVYAFIRAFKSNTGISPGKYQKDAGRR